MIENKALDMIYPLLESMRTTALKISSYSNDRADEEILEAIAVFLAAMEASLHRTICVAHTAWDIMCNENLVLKSKIEQANAERVWSNHRQLWSICDILNSKGYRGTALDIIAQCEHTDILHAADLYEAHYATSC
jgi:hypothetical protein